MTPQAEASTKLRPSLPDTPHILEHSTSQTLTVQRPQPTMFLEGPFAFESILDAPSSNSCQTKSPSRIRLPATRTAHKCTAHGQYSLDLPMLKILRRIDNTLFFGSPDVFGILSCLGHTCLGSNHDCLRRSRDEKVAITITTSITIQGQPRAITVPKHRESNQSL
jgi:hypothetical protein